MMKVRRRFVALFVAGAAAIATPAALVSASNQNCGVIPILNNCQFEGDGGGGGGGGGQQQQQQRGGGGGGGGGSSSSSSSSSSAGAAGSG